MTRGIILGKFAPLTKGHVSFINRAACRVDELCIVLCWDDKFQQTLGSDLQKTFSLKNRYRWLRDTFDKYPSITICYVDESEIASYPEGATDFTKLVRAELQGIYGSDKVTHAFSSEPDYEEYFAENFAEAKHAVIDADRNLVPISGTKVRENIYQNWDNIALAARPDLVKTVAVIGCESTGKSTLVKQLADYFGTEFVPEVGRTICEDEFYDHEEWMDVRDYEEVAYRHNTFEIMMLRRASKVLISDTNNLITEFSANLMGRSSPVLTEMSRSEGYDLVLYLDIDVPWVGDNLRRNGDGAKRQATDKLLRQMCEQRKVANIVHIGGSYENRFMRSVYEIKQLLGGSI